MARMINGFFFGADFKLIRPVSPPSLCIRVIRVIRGFNFGNRAKETAYLC